MSGITAIKFTSLEQKYLGRQSYSTDVLAIMNYKYLKIRHYYKKKTTQKTRKGTQCSTYWWKQPLITETVNDNRDTMTHVF